MTDLRLLDRTPRAEFAARLEGEFLRRSTSVETSHPAPEEATMTLQLDDEAVGQRPRPAWQWAALTAAALALVVAAVAVLTRGGDSDTPTSTGTPVTFSLAWEHTEKSHDSCADGDPQTCLNQFSLPAAATLAGDVVGHASQAVFWNAAGTVQGEQRNHVDHAAVYGFNGTVAGCPSGGQFMLVETIEWVSGPDFDGNSGTYTGSWQIVANSGRNGLKGIAGSGTSTSKPDTDVRTFTGTISCETDVEPGAAQP